MIRHKLESSAIKSVSIDDVTYLLKLELAILSDLVVARCHARDCRRYRRNDLRKNLHEVLGLAVSFYSELEFGKIIAIKHTKEECTFEVRMPCIQNAIWQTFFDRSLIHVDLLGRDSSIPFKVSCSIASSTHNLLCLDCVTVLQSNYVSFNFDDFYIVFEFDTILLSYK